MLYLPQIFILLLQLLLVDAVAPHFGHGTFVKEVEYCTVNLWAEIMVILEELKLTQGVGAERPGRGEGGCLEGFGVLMGVSV